MSGGSFWWLAPCLAHVPLLRPVKRTHLLLPTFMNLVQSKFQRSSLPLRSRRRTFLSMADHAELSAANGSPL